MPGNKASKANSTQKSASSQPINETPNATSSIAADGYLEFGAIKDESVPAAVDDKGEVNRYEYNIDIDILELGF